MKTIVILWETTEDGRSFAHFPEPFPMSAHEWTAFSSLFDRLGFDLDGDGDTRSARRSDIHRQLVKGLEGLGYAVDQRGDLPDSEK